MANTHLYAALDAAHIRIIQSQAILQYIKYYRENRLKELYIPDEKVSMVFCGDFNSQPHSGVYKLITQKHLPSDEPDLRSSKHHSSHIQIGIFDNQFLFFYIQ